MLQRGKPCCRNACAPRGLLTAVALSASWQLAAMDCTPTASSELEDVLSPDEPKKKRCLDLTPAERAQLLAAHRAGAGPAGNPNGEVHSTAIKCVFCLRLKHSCRWQYKTAGPSHRVTRSVTGSSCACCVRAAASLKVSRSYKVLQQVPSVLAKVVSLSAKLQNDLGSEDSCRCFECGGTWFS